MSPHQTIAVGVRLFAVWLVVYTARAAMSFYAEGNWQFALAIVILAAILVGVLWYFPKTIAHKILSSPTSEAPTASSDTYLSVGSALIGLWLLSETLPYLVRNVYMLFVAGKMHDDTESITTFVIYDLARSAIAVWLILGARGFKRIYWWAQNAGRK